MRAAAAEVQDAPWHDQQLKGLLTIEKILPIVPDIRITTNPEADHFCTKKQTGGIHTNNMHANQRGLQLTALRQSFPDIHHQVHLSVLAHSADTILTVCQLI